MTEPLQAVGNDVFLSLKHPLQPRRFALALFFSLILFPLIAAGLIAGTVVIIVPFVAFLLWFGGRVWFARFLGNSILVSELNYPRIYRIGEDLKAAIGYTKKINIFVYEQGNFNAYLMKFFFFRRAVFLNSELLETGVTDNELRWVIGRFIGYLRARRQSGFWGWTIRAAQHLLVFNLFLMPYERALVYTGDRIALAVITGDISSAVSAMQKLFVGRQLGYSVNPNGLLDQHRLVKGSIFAFLARLFMAFPHMTARYVDLIGFAKERYSLQFERFEAENPGLPSDLKQLTALPEASAVLPGARDPIWAPLAGAVAVLALLTLLTVKVIVPRYSGVGSYSRATGLETTTEGSTASTPVVETRTESSAAASQAGASGAKPEAETSAAAPQTQTSAALSQLRPYTSTTGRFSVVFPGAPTQNARPLALSDGVSVTMYQFEYTEGSSSYVVMYNDYPGQYVTGEAQMFLEHVRDGIVSAIHATLNSDQPVDMNGVPGRLLKLTDQKGATYLVLDLLDGQRLYQLIGAAGTGASTKPAEDFLNSFRIL